MTGWVAMVAGIAMLLAAAHPAAVVAAVLTGKAVPAGVLGAPGHSVRNEDFSWNAGNGDECHKRIPCAAPKLTRNASFPWGRHSRCACFDEGSGDGKP